jgi:hypothetical protein
MIQVLQYSGHFGITITQRSIAYNSQILTRQWCYFVSQIGSPSDNDTICALLHHLHQINISRHKQLLNCVRESVSLVSAVRPPVTSIRAHIQKIQLLSSLPNIYYFTCFSPWTHRRNHHILIRRVDSLKSARPVLPLRHRCKSRRKDASNRIVEL